MKKALILGAGFAGCTSAHLLKKAGWQCTIIEKNNHIGGGCWTYFYGGHPYTKGPRVYYGYSDKIHRWVNSFVALRSLPLHLLSYVKQESSFFTYPIHEDDLPRMKNREKIYEELSKVDLKKTPANFEEYWINRVGQTLYDMFVNSYSKKMWDISSNKEIDTFQWSAKDKPIASGSHEVYKNSIMAYPIPHDGYNSYFYKTIEGSQLILNKSVDHVDLIRKKVKLSDGAELQGDIIVSTIPIEELCSYTLGDLPYMGRDFIEFVLPCKQIFPDNLRFCHYTQNEVYTRIVEYKKLTFHEAEDTLLVMEIPSKNGKLYPYMFKKYIQRAKKYLESLPKNIFSIGRLGTYKYSTMEQTIVQSFQFFHQLTGKTVDGMEKEFFAIGDEDLLKSRFGDKEVA